jgi:competence protein ComEA
MLKKMLAMLAIAVAAAASFAAVTSTRPTAAELDGVTRHRPGHDGAILDERKKGAFKDWNDFIGRVKGVGEGNAAKFSRRPDG